MCGITGLYTGDGSVIKEETLIGSVNNLKHRGPDDRGIYFNKNKDVGLGHTRLSIQDISSNGHQPMISEDGRFALVLNGEIYNFQELRQYLVNKNITFKSHGDTEVLLKLYQWYILNDINVCEMLKTLNGIFAFAVYDNLTKTLFVSRDCFGVKPLYYISGENGFYFSSEIKGIVPLTKDLGELDLQSIQLYLSYLWCPGSGTLLSKIKKLNPGRAIWIRKGKIQKEKTWYELPVLSSEKTICTLTDGIEHTDFKLRQAVHRQLISDVPVGAFLSGGLDSSAIVSFAIEKNPDIKCFTIDTGSEAEAGIVADLPYAKKVAQYLDVQLDVIKVDSKMMADQVENMFFQLDEPLGDPAPLNVLFISQLAKQNGIKVLLSGAGGDDLFTGYRRHHALNLENYWSWLPKTFLSIIEKSTQNLDQSIPSFRRLAKLFRGSSLNEVDRIINYFKWLPDQDTGKLFSHEKLSAMKQFNNSEVMKMYLSNSQIQTTKLDKMLALDQRFFLTEHNLNYTDKMSMATGVEARVPFLDNDLVYMSSLLDDKLRQNGKIGKFVLKKTMEKYLPREIIYRPKSGFGAPLVKWFKNELKPILFDTLNKNTIQERGIFHWPEIEELMKKSQSGRLDASYVLFSILGMELWWKKTIN
jgi:asparagine synthase (glutamine-hydrolysing)